MVLKQKPTVSIKDNDLVTLSSIRSENLAESDIVILAKAILEEVRNELSLCTLPAEPNKTLVNDALIGLYVNLFWESQ
jgi:hypothetical protein